MRVQRSAIQPGERIRVLHILPWVVSGGVERRRLSLARHLPAERFEQRVFCLNARESIPAELQQAGVEVVSCEGASVRDARVWLRLLRLVRSWKPDIIHGAVFEGVTMASFAAVACPAAALITEETSESTTRSRRAQRLFRLLSARAYAVVAISPAVGRLLVTATGIDEERVRVIANGVEAPRDVGQKEREDARKVAGLSADRLVLGAVARLFDDSNKRISDLLRALSLREAHNWQLLIVGDGPARATLEELALALGVDERVHFVGYRADTAPWYEVMDAFALVSRNEGFGLVAVEAMFHRLPVIATRVGGLRDIVIDEKTGLHVAVGVPAEIAEALQRLGADPALRASMGARGAERAAARYSAERYASDIAALYEEALALTSR